MNINFHYAYLILNLPFLLAWLLFWAFSKTTRKKQLVVSLMLMPLGTLTEIMYFQDYWNPDSVLFITFGPVRILLEDFLFAFLIAGLASVAYDVTLNRKHNDIGGMISKTRLFFVIVIGALTSIGLFLNGVNSIFATSAGFMASAIFILIQRNNLLPNAIGGGTCIMFIMFLSYLALFNIVANTEDILRQGWYLHGTALDIRLCGIPLTELVWGFSYGFFVGPLYEFIKKR